MSVGDELAFRRTMYPEGAPDAAVNEPIMEDDVTLVNPRPVGWLNGCVDSVVMDIGFNDAVFVL